MPNNSLCPSANASGDAFHLAIFLKEGLENEMSKSMDRRWEKKDLYIEIIGDGMSDGVSLICVIESNSQEFKNKFPNYADIMSLHLQGKKSKCEKMIAKIERWCNDNGYEWRQPSKNMK